MEPGKYNYSLRIVTPPIGEPVTIDEVKEWAHIDHDVEDQTIAGWIRTAREKAEAFQGRSYFEQVWELSFDKFPVLPLWLPRSPVLSVDSIKYYNTSNTETSMVLTDFYIDSYSVPAQITHGYTKVWPGIVTRYLRAVVITYTCGYGTVEIPQAVKEAIILYCSFRNQNRTSEIDQIPDAFYSLLSPDRLFV